MATRIQSKSRPIKRGSSITWNTGAGNATFYVGRKYRTDKKGFPVYKGIPAPVLVQVTVAP